MRLILIFLVLYCLPSYGQKDYDSIRNTAPREKLYIHFDKSIYTLTDTIWFKAYLADASTHAASPLSGLIYTELINSKTGEIIHTLSLPTAMGVTWGSFALNDGKYKPGSYIFRAYTNWMQNFGETHFFKREIKIVSLSNEVVSSAKKIDTSLKQKLQDIDIQFLPEGGKLIAGISQKIAFKAIDAKGKGVAVQGEILDSKQRKITNFQSNPMGMGYVNILPTNGETYMAMVSYRNLVKQIDLPKTQSDGTILQVNNHYSRDSIKVIAYTNALSNQEVTILGQSRGQLCFTSKIRFNTNIKFIYIPKTAFPSGVSQVLLMEGNKVLNERSFFINHKDELKLLIASDQPIYSTRDSIPLTLGVVNKDGKPIEGSFSISVTDDNQVSKDSVNDATILSYLLLSSDLKGEIEKPGYYFQHTDEQKHNDLESLMLTQGWVSYDWDLSKKPSYQIEKEYTINGRVFGLFNRPIPKAKMTLFGKNRGILLLNTIANDKGQFTFSDLPLIDSASFIIQAKNMKDKAGALTIEVDEFKRPQIVVNSQKASRFVDVPLDSTTKKLVTTKIEEAKLTFNEGILLNEVQIIGKKAIKKSKNLIGPGEADITITETELNKTAKKPLFELVQEKIPGFVAGKKSKYYPRDFWVDGRLLKFVIDGTPIDFFYLRRKTIITLLDDILITISRKILLV